MEILFHYVKSSLTFLSREASITRRDMSWNNISYEPPLRQMAKNVASLLSFYLHRFWVFVAAEAAPTQAAKLRRG